MTYEIDLKSVTSELSIPKGGSEEVLHKNRESYTRWRVNLFQWDFFSFKGRNNEPGLYVSVTVHCYVPWISTSFARVFVLFLHNAMMKIASSKLRNLFLDLKMAS